MDAQQLPDLLRLRGSVVAASDEFFAAKENLIRPDAPIFVPETYDIFPDGGVARLRLYGSLTEDGLAAVRRRWAETA